MDKVYLVIRVTEGAPLVVLRVEYSLEDAEYARDAARHQSNSQIYIQEVYGY